MMPEFPKIILGTLLVSGLAVGARPGPAWGGGRESYLEQEIDDSIDRGVEYLLAELAGPNGWSPAPDYFSGYLALQLYALLKNDVSYLHPVVLEGLRLLDSQPLEKVYSVSLSLMACAAALDQLEEDGKSGGPLELAAPAGGRQPPGTEAILKMMKESCAWLLHARVRSEGVWSYEPPPPRASPGQAKYDHSNSQFAILALGVAARHGLPVPREVWEEIADHFVRVQETKGNPVKARPIFVRPRSSERKPARETAGKDRAPDPMPEGEKLYRDPGAAVAARGWGYQVKKNAPARPTFSMTSAGQSSVLLAHRYLVKGGARIAALERTIRDGYGWLSGTLDSVEKFQFKIYDLYSLEKVGDLGGVESFGSCRWFERGAGQLIYTQLERGHWGGPANSPEARHQTALALLFLSRATALEGPREPLVRQTGGRQGARDLFADRYWVYLQSLGAEVPMIRFFRRLRYRPTRQLIKLSEELLDAYDPDFLNELVYFFKALDLSPFPKVKEHGSRLLQKLTGLKAEDPLAYLDWAARWEEVVQIGRLQDARSGERLREWLRQTASLPLKLKILWALQRVDHRAAIGDLLPLMESKEAALRQAAFQAVSSLSGQDFPFQASGSEKARAQQLEKWKEWWKEAQKNSTLEKSP